MTGTSRAIAVASLLLLSGCTADMWTMTEGQLDRALWRMTVSDCQSRARSMTLAEGREARIERIVHMRECAIAVERQTTD